MSSKLIRLVTRSSAFAGIYLFSFFGVIACIFYTKGEPFWVKTGWAMFALLGVFVTVTGAVSFMQAYRSRYWPRAGATLTKAWVDESRLHDNRVVYSPMVEYEYTVGAKHYQGDCIDFSARSGSRRWAQRVLDSIGACGRLIQVHYSPDDPAVSVIDPGVRFVHLLRFLIGPAIVLVGMLSALGILDLFGR
jgi:hypothetical protein